MPSSTESLHVALDLYLKNIQLFVLPRMGFEPVLGYLALNGVKKITSYNEAKMKGMTH